jgi:transcriptional regulator with XRE-family HTH domain
MSNVRHPNSAGHPQTRDRAAALGDVIRSHRLRMGLSQEQLADLVGVDRQSINRWENAAYSPSLHRLLQLADVLRVRLSVLIADAERAARAAERRTA